MIYEDFAIAEHRDLQTIAFDDPRSMCGGKVAPTAKEGNLGFLKSLALLDKSRLAEIARVIVRDRQSREMLL
jgi:hypothetical protein